MSIDDENVAITPFDTLSDARIFVYNSGVADWEWSEGCDLVGLAQFVYQKADGDLVYDDLIAQYVSSRTGQTIKEVVHEYSLFK